jgi:hypothetical protein
VNAHDDAPPTQIDLEIDVALDIERLDEIARLTANRRRR